MKKTALALFFIATLLWPGPGERASAQNQQNVIPLTPYQLLEPLPFVTSNPNCGGPGNPCKTDANTYIPGLFRLGLAVASGLAVIRLIWGGFIKLSSDAYSGQNEAKEIIKNALTGLILALGAWIIVATFFPTRDGSIVIDLSVPARPLPPSNNQPNPTPGGGGGGQTGCQGSDCVNSYINSERDTVRYKECSDCVEVRSLNLKLKREIEMVNGKKAMINKDLGEKLKNISGESDAPLFRINEAWPPTVNHSNQKQYDGRSVDISLTSPDAAKINKFLELSRAKGLDAVYEVKTQGEKDRYVSQGVPAGSILVWPRISGEHFSVPPR